MTEIEKEVQTLEDLPNKEDIKTVADLAIEDGIEIEEPDVDKEETANYD